MTAIAAAAVERSSDWIQTYTGKQFWPLDPRAEEVDLDDIAHALSNMCRFTGHVSTFYSVAQHSVLASRLVPAADAKWALLHDASEAYLHDLPRPLKRAPVFGELYKMHEAKLMAVICQRFGLPEREPESVHVADTRLLITERRDLMGAEVQPWVDKAKPLDTPIICWSPKDSEMLFKFRYQQICRAERVE